METSDFEMQLEKELQQIENKQIDQIENKSENKSENLPEKKPRKKRTAKQKIPSAVTQVGKNTPKKLSATQRELIRKQLVMYYGASKVDKFLLGTTTIDEVQDRLKSMRDRMEKEIEQKEQDSTAYFSKIDDEYNKVGRPNAPFSYKELDYLCSIGCTASEIAGFFDIHLETLRRRVKKEFGLTFNQYYERRSQGIKIALRRAQIHSAIEGDTNMQKFLGINLLGQKNKIEFEGQVQVNTFADLVKAVDEKSNTKKEKDDVELDGDDYNEINDPENYNELENYDEIENIDDDDDLNDD